MTSFEALYGRPPEVAAEAPGRVNLIGEHTDYNGGFVLPLAIPQRTRVELARRADRTVQAWSATFGGEVRGFSLGAERRRGDWLDYVQGVTMVARAGGLGIGGFDLRIESRVPPGSGLASSAALEVALLRALREAFGLELDDVRLAKLGQRAENDFVGAQVGIMDQLAASLASPGEALFVDTRSLAYEKVALPAGVELLVIDSGVSHGHAGGEYNTRRAECRRAAALLGVTELRDVTSEALERVAALPGPLDRRARHVVTENERVPRAVEALRAGHLARLGALFDASHASLRDDYEVSIRELDLLVELCRSEAAVYGARMTGGGFGGSIVALARAGEAGAVGRRVVRAYEERTGRRGTVLLPESAG